MAEKKRRQPSLREAVPGLGRILRRFSHHVRDQRRLLVLGSLALLAEVAMRLLEPWPLAYVIDHLVVQAGAELGSATGAAQEQPGLGTAALLTLCAVGLLAVVALRALASYAMTVCFALAGNRVLTRVRSELYAHLNRLSVAFHDKARTGDLVTRVTGDVGRLQEATVTALLPLVGNVVTLVGMLVVIAVLDPVLGLVVLVVLPFFAVINVRLTRRIAGVSREQRSAEGAIASLATESLGSMRVVHSYSLAGRLQERFGGSNERSLRDGVRAKKLSAGLERKTDVLVGVATALVLWAGGWRVLSGDLTPGELTVFLTYLKTAMKPMRDVAKYTGRIAKAAASGERIVDVLDQRPDLVDASWARPAPRFRGWVELRDVWLAYSPGHPTLRGLDLRVRAGERVAVVGPSGSGKSTLVALLSRLRDPDQGQVMIDGHDLRDLTLESVRSQVSVVLQESVLFALSVRENIALGVSRDVTDEEIEEAARTAGAHDFIMALPDGYDTVVGERGATLSGGQRQRIAIARAAVRRAPVVVLDEALTGLDPQTEGEVVGALRRLTEGRTTFVVTHDLEAARDADRVVWIEEGTVRLQGAPDEVLGVMARAGHA
ncbi:ABC transporter ATP-binding protein [Xylanimonas oleitrophica]|uniref:ABC transporter ATP-binding protein n=1 Tax=Xylanimonas oleitrophica TaxID=2607479 RepID=A0A2W5WPN5_9MICO|nr:ABC transporter ATP-binding protein [Xylanimonas oleitrophica]PZR52653.1 ABC transporter ATP-binding protein [Xylanimonas oleitrophica]